MCVSEYNSFLEMGCQAIGTGTGACRVWTQRSFLGIWTTVPPHKPLSLASLLLPQISPGQDFQGTVSLPFSQACESWGWEKLLPFRRPQRRCHLLPACHGTTTTTLLDQLPPPTAQRPRPRPPRRRPPRGEAQEGRLPGQPQPQPGGSGPPSPCLVKLS